MKKITDSVVVLFLIGSCFAGAFTIVAPPKVSAYTPHDPILIDGDADFAAQAAAEGWPGDGTEGNPYVIEGYEINVEEDHGIGIEGTQVHFVIRNSLVEKAIHTTSGRYFTYQSGIYLRDVLYGKIDNCTLKNNRHGIFLDGSIGIEVSNNTMIGNGIRIEALGWIGKNGWYTYKIDTTNTVNGKPVYFWKNQTGGNIPYGAGQVILVNCTNVTIEKQDLSQGSIGIQFAYCYNITITLNNITSNNMYGISLYSSNGNTISNNNIISNNALGIHNSDSDNNDIVANNISLNKGTGIYIYKSVSNFIRDNKIYSNSGEGIHLSDSVGNNITNNIVSSNNLEGIGLSSSDRNNIYNNNLSYNNCGISIRNTREIDIQGNTMRWDGIRIDGYPIECWNTHKIDISNTVNGKPIYFLKNQTGGKIPSGAGQVILVNCTDIIIDSQELSHTYIGIQLVYSLNITIINNNANFNGEYGFYLWQSNMNNIINNTISNGKYGIYLGNSMQNDLSNNTFSNGDYGIYLEYSTGNDITYNDVSLYSHGGIKLYHSTDNLFHHNNLIDNDYQLSSVGSMMNIWDDGNGEGNYWSDYYGVDENGDGVGDTDLPHRGVEFNPLMEPVGSVGDDISSSSLLLLIIIFPLIIFLSVVILAFLTRKKRKPTEIPPEQEEKAEDGEI